MLQSSREPNLRRNDLQDTCIGWLTVFALLSCTDKLAGQPCIPLAAHGSHYGTCSVASALMTSPSADSDLLIACASFSVSPDAPDFFTLRAVLHLFGHVQQDMRCQNVILSHS